MPSSSSSMTATRRLKAVKIPRPLHANQHAIFAALLKQEGIPAPTTELRFAAPRRWRFDYAWTFTIEVPAGWADKDLGGPTEVRVALEVEGGAFSRGRHVRGKGFLNDCEKYSEAAALGWRIIRVPPSDLCHSRTIEWIRRALYL